MCNVCSVICGFDCLGKNYVLGVSVFANIWQMHPKLHVEQTENLIFSTLGCFCVALDPFGGSLVSVKGAVSNIHVSVGDYCANVQEKGPTSRVDELNQRIESKTTSTR